MNYLKNVKHSVTFNLNLFTDTIKNKILYIVYHSRSKYTLTEDKMLTVDSKVALEILTFLHDGKKEEDETHHEKSVSETTVTIIDNKSEMFKKTGTIIDKYGNFYVIKIGDEEFVYPENKIKILKD